MEECKKVIVVGSGNSGSGAIFDYLKGRPDFISPLSQEFRLIQDPGGIMDLHSALVHGFHVNRASSAISNFEDFCERCGRDKTKYQYGLYYSRDLENFDQKVNQFIEDITVVEYEGMAFCERSKLSKWETFFIKKMHKRAKNRGRKFTYGTVRLPVPGAEFLEAAETFLTSIFDISHLEGGSEKNVAIDQGGSYWKPASSNAYYGNNCKTIVVSRDPRGIFSSFKTKGKGYPGGNVKLFCKWFGKMMQHVDYSEWEHENVLHIQYEQFVLNFEDEKQKLDLFLGIPEHLKSTSDISQSAFNAEKFKSRLTSEELKTIENELEEFLYF